MPVLREPHMLVDFAGKNFYIGVRKLEPSKSEIIADSSAWHMNDSASGGMQ
jgi:hypothetical protein